MTIRHSRFLAIALAGTVLLVISCAACGQHPEQSVYKINNDLILRAPPKELAGHASGQPNPATASPSELPQADFAGFILYMPDLSFVRPAGHPSITNWDPDRVGVDIYPDYGGHIDRPVSYSPYPPMARFWIKYHFVNAANYHDIYGLRCWRWTEYDNCYGKRDNGEDISLMVDLPPNDDSGNSQLKAEYYSARFGGVKIFWITGVKNLSHWRQIDTKVWKTIDSWNIAQSSRPGK